MTDEQIIKALECCSKKDCKQCPAYDEDIECGENIIKFALDLINRQNATIKKQFEAIQSGYKFVEEQKAEIERLKVEIRNTDNILNALDRPLIEVKSETYREFAKKLRKYYDEYEDYENIYAHNIRDDIDNTLKELTSHTETDHKNHSVSLVKPQ